MIFVHLENIESFGYFLKKGIDEDFSYNVTPVALRVKGFSKFLYKLLSSKKVFKLFPFLPRRWLCRYLIDKKTLSKIKNQNNVCFVIHGYTDLTFLYNQYLQSAFPTSKRIIVFEDKIEHYCDNYRSFDIKKVQDSFDCALTYNSFDSKEYEMPLYPPIVPDFSSFEDSYHFKQIDVFFIGRDKGRLSTIIDLYDSLRENGLICEFHLIGIPKRKRVFRDSIIYHNKPLPYAFTLAKNKSTKAILNVMQDGATGVTLRDFEAISLNKVLITNCKDIKDYDFYSSEKVVFTDSIHFLNNDALLEKEKLTWNNVGLYNISNYYRVIKKELQNKKLD